MNLNETKKVIATLQNVAFKNYRLAIFLLINTKENQIWSSDVITKIPTQEKNVSRYNAFNNYQFQIEFEQITIDNYENVFIEFIYRKNCYIGPIDKILKIYNSYKNELNLPDIKIEKISNYKYQKTLDFLINELKFFKITIPEIKYMIEHSIDKLGLMMTKHY